MRVGLLGLQGAFLDHIPHLEALNAGWKVVRTSEDLPEVDRLILPGGESTVMARFLAAFGMIDPLVARIRAGMPVWGICAGSILLAETVDGRPGVLAALPAAVKRNAYGRQLASATRPISVPQLDRPAFSAMFIRAPRFESLGTGVEVLARSGPDPVCVRYGTVLATTFHPELTRDPVFHEFFIGL